MGTLWWTYKKLWKDPPFLMGKSTISMAIIKCYVSSPEGNIKETYGNITFGIMIFPRFNLPVVTFLDISLEIPKIVGNIGNWLVVWNIFPYIGNNDPNWLSYFFAGVETTSQIKKPYFTTIYHCGLTLGGLVIPWYILWKNTSVFFFFIRVLPVIYAIYMVTFTINIPQSC